MKTTIFVRRSSSSSRRSTRRKINSKAIRFARLSSNCAWNVNSTLEIHQQNRINYTAKRYREVAIMARYAGV